MGLHTPVSTLRRDMNSEYVALARHVNNELLAAREVIAATLGEIERIKHREQIWAGAVIVGAVCLLAVAAHLVGLM
jgi:hypothetical protein